ncbi:cob(I)yrinic acid a,c-diamide adenosyltransferase [Betaproteobacteria bacterium SCN2]|jgi:cob(I)alamin adenosyltransferase|nr:cob(I)yrinic acid a,c-diamide adenosyltransferase [Betaproteobacteria bacterium SCN2]
MGNRLSKITTRTGDDGSTGLADRTRVRKDHPRVEAMGDVDELNSQLGLLLTEPLPADIRELLIQIQHHLFDLGGELAMPEYSGITEAKLVVLDEAIERHNAALPPLKEFVLPGGSRASALAHVCRTVCRRAERRVVSLVLSDAVSPLQLHYLNRLSDLLFVLARVLNQGSEPGQWKKGGR